MTDDAVTQCLIDIRKALDDSAQEIVKTVPRRGYIFEAQIEPLNTEEPAAPVKAGGSWRPAVWILTAAAAVVVLGLFVALNETPQDSFDASTSAREAGSPALAVMPLVNMSSHEDNVYFAGGVHEEVLTNLSRIEGLHAISRTATLRYAASELTLREVSNELGVDYIVEGSVRRIGNHVRVTVQLINARNDLNLWANTYERELVDVFATQSALAREITDSIRLEIQPEWVGMRQDIPTTSVKAYDLFIRAKSIEKTEGETEEAMVRRRKMLEEAVGLDPEFAEGWAVLNRLYDLQLSRLRSRDWYISEGEDRDALVADLTARSKRALDKAIALDPENVETLLARAVDYARSKTDAERQAKRELYDQIIARVPENAKAWYHLGFWYSHLEELPEYDRNDVAPDAAAAFEEALRLDPFNARMVSAVLKWYRDRGYLEDVTRLSDRLIQIMPESAADRRLARVSWNFKSKQIRSAFEATADEALIDDFRKGWEEAIENGDYSGSISVIQYWHEAILSNFTGDLDRLIELSNMRPDLNEGVLNPRFFFLLKWTAMKIHEHRGDADQARLVARSILKQEDVIRALNENGCTCYLGALSAANEVLGNMELAQQLVQELIDGTGWSQEERTQILGYMDVEQAVAAAFAELAEKPSWKGFDEMAAGYVWNLDFLVHPRVQEYYVNEGKWISYLSARVPEYEKYIRDAEIY